MLKFAARAAPRRIGAVRHLRSPEHGHIMWISAGQAAAHAGRGHQL
jgi:hypothetical protein